MAKARTVIVVLELETDIPLLGLRSKCDWQESAAVALERWGGNLEVHQIIVTVPPTKNGKGNKWLKQKQK